MNEEKQIEEMAEIMRNSCEKECRRNKYGEFNCEYCEAELLYNAGYRKQEEGKWILQQNGKGICSKCNRQDSMDELACFCRYCGARMKGV